MFDKVLKLWRETFPKSEHKLMRIEYVAAIEEFNEYFPGYAAMNDKNYSRLQRYFRGLRPFHGCIMPFRVHYASALALENSLEDYLEKNPQYRRTGLTGEWAIHIFSDHNDHVIEKYREYKTKRLEKLARTFEERKKRADQLNTQNEFRLKWLLGRDGFYKYNACRLATMEKEQEMRAINRMRVKEESKRKLPRSP